MNHNELLAYVGGFQIRFGKQQLQQVASKKLTRSAAKKPVIYRKKPSCNSSTSYHIKTLVDWRQVPGLLQPIKNQGLCGLKSNSSTK